MAKKNFIPQKYREWIEVRKQLKLSHRHIQMARELGITPKKLPRLAKTQGATWKAPLAEYITVLYERRFKRSGPERVRSIEEMAKAEMHKREGRRQRRAARNESESQNNETTEEPKPS